MISVIKALLTTISVFAIFLFGMKFAIEHPIVSKELIKIISLHNSKIK